LLVPECDEKILKVDLQDSLHSACHLVWRPVRLRRQLGECTHLDVGYTSAD